MRLLILVLALVAGCTSPESTRERGGGPGADRGNRGNPVVMHAGSDPYAGTPKLIPGPGVPVEGARQAAQLSRGAE